MLKQKISVDEERVKRECNVAATKLEELRERVGVVEGRPGEDGTMYDTISEMDQKTTAIETVFGARIKFMNKQLGARLDAVNSPITKVDTKLAEDDPKPLEADERVEGQSATNSLAFQPS